MILLLKNIDEIYMNSSSDGPIENGYIIIKNNNIFEIGSNENKKSIDNNKYDRIIDCRGKIALPGLVNVHTHAAMSLLRGFADDLSLHDWLRNKIWPYEASLNADEIYWGSLMAIIEMINTGTTTFADMYFQMEEVAKAVEETGIRAVLSEGLIETNDGSEALKDSIAFCNNWNNQAEDRITTMLAPHSPYTCSTVFLKKVIMASQKNNLPINIHIAETEKEFEDIQQKYGKSPVEYLNNIGLFEGDVLAAHCVYLSEDDIKILAEKNIGIGYNPASNMKLGSGISPVVKLLKKGADVGIGTDGMASNNNLDLIEEARLGSYLQKVYCQDPTVMGIEQILSMLTETGAKILSLSKVGKIKTGFKADIILIDIKNDSFFYPHHNNLSNLFYAANGGSVDTVLINGKMIYEKGRFITLDRERIFKKIEKIIEKKNV